MPTAELAEALADFETYYTSDVAQENRELCEFAVPVMYALSQQLRMEIMTILMHKSNLQMSDFILLIRKDRYCIEALLEVLMNAKLVTYEAKKNRRRYFSITPFGASWMRKLQLW
jgi:hypothetical protein